MEEISMRVGDKKPSLNTKVFEVVDQKLTRAVSKCVLGLMGALEAKMTLAMPKSCHLFFKRMYILPTQAHHSDFERGHGLNLISESKEPHLVFLKCIDWDLADDREREAQGRRDTRIHEGGVWQRRWMIKSR